MSSSRQSRLYLSSRIVSLIRSNDENGLFSGQELLHVENLLRDEFMTNQWLYSVCNAISDDSVFVSQQECELYEKSQTQDQLITVSESQINDLQNKLKFFKEKAMILTYLYKDLNKKLAEVCENDSQTDEKQENNRHLILSNLNIKLQESLTLLKSDVSSRLTVNDPKDIVEQMMSQLRDKPVQNNGQNNPIDWLSQQFDELALSHINRREILQKLNSELFERLENLNQSLIKLYKECHRIKDFYEINIREEMLWRENLKQALTQIREISQSVKICLTEMSNESNDLSAKRQELLNNSKLFEKIESQELDEFEPLINALKERIEILQTNNVSNS